MSYVLQQKHHTYINYDVNHLANVCLDNSAILWPYNWPFDCPFWNDYFTECVVFQDQLGNAKKSEPIWVQFVSLLELLLTAFQFLHPTGSSLPRVKPMYKYILLFKNNYRI